jgi:hypothetical protein
MKLSEFSKDFDIVETQLLAIVKKSLDRRSVVFDTPTLSTTSCRYDGMKFSKKYFDLFTLIFVSYKTDFFGDFSEYLRYEIEVYLDKTLNFPDLNASLVSETVLDFVLFQLVRKYGTNWLFGKICQEGYIESVLRKVQIRYIKPIEPRKLVRRRGYKDQGTLRPETLWLPKDDWSFDVMQSQIEKQRENYQNAVSLIVRECGGWVLRRQQYRKEV